MNASIIELSPDCDELPEGGNWILIEEDESGEWFGTGFGLSAEGKQSLYISEGESDANYHLAIGSASEWARKNQVDTIYVLRRRR